MKNHYEIKGDVTEIHFQKYGIFTMIDTEDLEKVLNVGHISWCVGGFKGARWSYIVGNVKGKRLYLHRVITDAPKGMVVDHINHNTIDNRKCNLQLMTGPENTKKRNKITYEWQEKVTEVMLKNNSKVTVHREHQREKREEKKKIIMDRQAKSRAVYTSVQTGIEWDPQKKRFEPTYEYKAV